MLRYAPLALILLACESATEPVPSDPDLSAAAPATVVADGRTCVIAPIVVTGGPVDVLEVALEADLAGVPYEVRWVLHDEAARAVAAAGSYTVAASPPVTVRLTWGADADSVETVTLCEAGG